MKRKSEIVAVYGTLKQSYNNHYMLATSKFIGSDAVAGYIWTAAGESFPRACHDIDAPGTIKVELYEVSARMMHQMARLETPYGYYMQAVMTVNGVNALMWASVEGPDPDCKIILSGNWG